MGHFSGCRPAATLLIAILFASGCGSFQGQTIGFSAPTSTATNFQSLRHGTSGDLIYATGACGGTCILSYPQGALVGSLNVGDAGTCADKTGNVFIANQNSLFEYAHGGSTPIKTFFRLGGRRQQLFRRSKNRRYCCNG